MACNCKHGDNKQDMYMLTWLTWIIYMGCMRDAAAIATQLGLPADISFLPYNTDLARLGQVCKAFRLLQSAPAGNVQRNLCLWPFSCHENFSRFDVAEKQNDVLSACCTVAGACGKLNHQTESGGVKGCANAQHTQRGQVCRHIGLSQPTGGYRKKLCML